MKFTFVVPYSVDGSRRIIGRDENWTVVRDHLRAEVDGGDALWQRPVHVGIAPCEPTGWSKGAAVHNGVRTTGTDGLVIHDADALVAPGALRTAARAVAAGAPWAMPHTAVWRLSRRGTARYLAAYRAGGTMPRVDPLWLERRPHVAPAGGGVVVLTRAAYDLVGGIDPRFHGWGGEDISFARALNTLVGQGLHGDAPLIHLWHTPDPTRVHGRGPPPNERLAGKYLDASGDYEAMRELVRR